MIESEVLKEIRELQKAIQGAEEKHAKVLGEIEEEEQTASDDLLAGRDPSGPIAKLWQKRDGLGIAIRGLRKRLAASLEEYRPQLVQKAQSDLTIHNDAASKLAAKIGSAEEALRKAEEDYRRHQQVGAQLSGKISGLQGCPALDLLGHVENEKEEAKT